MDIQKANKPIHIQCPYCHKDLQYNGSSIKSRKEGLVRRIESLNRKIGMVKNSKEKANYRYQRNKTLRDLKVLSEDIHMLSQLSEMETLKIFKRKVSQIIPKEQYMELIKESEKEYLEENTFNYYDLAIQNHNNFDGI